MKTRRKHMRRLKKRRNLQDTNQNSYLKSIVNCFFTKPINFKLILIHTYVTPARATVKDTKASPNKGGKIIYKGPKLIRTKGKLLRLSNRKKLGKFSPRNYALWETPAPTARTASSSVSAVAPATTFWPGPSSSSSCPSLLIITKQLLSRMFISHNDRADICPTTYTCRIPSKSRSATAPTPTRPPRSSSPSHQPSLSNTLNIRNP